MDGEQEGLAEGFEGEALLPTPQSRCVTNVTQMESNVMYRPPADRWYRDRVRRTVDFALDTEQMIRHRMATRGISFEQAVNDSIRQGFDRGVLDEPLAARTLCDEGVPADR